jgi:Pyruvate/2-oxoacid:ferredoxin oxidoreductase delta subunit
MSRPVLPEWAGETLVYLSPRETINRMGYQAPSQRADLLPHEIEHFRRIDERVPEQDGEPAPVRAAPGSPERAAAELKERAAALGAGMVGITAVDPRYVYAGHDVPHAHAVMIAVALQMEEVLQMPRPESNAEHIRAYDEAGRIVVELARWIRGLGYPARAHTLRSEAIAMIPHAQAAGMGELGKHGSLINRRLGCSFRLAALTTDLPLVHDEPVDEGIEDFCRSCRMCVAYCPGDAISDERDVVRGTERWIVDTALCAPYFGSHYACGVCLRVCPINARAFDGRFRDAFVESVRALDADGLKAGLTAELRPLAAKGVASRTEVRPPRAR